MTAAPRLSVLLAGTYSDLDKAASILNSCSNVSCTVVRSQRTVLETLSSYHVAIVEVQQQYADGQREGDWVDALATLRVPERTTPVAVMMDGQDDAVLSAAVQLGAHDILQSPISEQADRLRFLATKWQHTLVPSQQSCGDHKSGSDPASDCFSLLDPVDSLEELLGPSSTTSCVTEMGEWEQSEALVQSILPGVFGPDDGHDVCRAASCPAPGSGLEHVFTSSDLADPLAMLTQVETAQPSGSCDSSISHAAGLSRQPSLDLSSLSGKRKSDEFSDMWLIGNQNDVTADTKIKKAKVLWTPALHETFVAAVEKLGVDKAVPSRILEEMGAAGVGLTRQNIASHLQMYRQRSRATSAAGVGALNSHTTSLQPGFAAGTFGSQPMQPQPLHAVQMQAAMLGGVPCWSPPGSLMTAYSMPANFCGWQPAAAHCPVPASTPAASIEPGPQLVASWMREASQGKLPIGLDLDAASVISKWRAANDKSRK